MGFQPIIDIPKNTRLTEKWIEKNRDKVQDFLQWCLLYPDCFLDMITPKNTQFKLFFYQRIALRAMMRYRYVYIDAPRAFSKSYIAILAGYLRCMFLPGEKFFICAPGKEQGAKIAQEKLKELWTIFPFLEHELVKKNMSKDYVTLVFKNGSVFDVVGALDSTRGGRRHAGIIDETRDHDGQTLTEVVLPLMNVDRRTVLGELDESEPNQAQYFITSAGQKGTFAYEKLIELYVQSIIAPETTFVMGCTYRVPMQHGLLNRSYIEDLKLSSTFRPDSFAREYLSVWTGGSDDSWLNYDRLSRYRRIVNPMTRRKNGESDGTFYYIAVDVARIGVLTSVMVMRVLPGENHFQKQLVNCISFHDTHFGIQAIEIKKLIAAFQPREVLIDGTGMGVGLLDFMVIEQLDEVGNIWPAYSSFNDEEYGKYNGERLLNVLKATPKLNSAIHTNCYNQVVNGYVKFLINEQDAKSKLQATKKGLRMPSIDKLHRLAPHMETTKLMDEICNLRIKNVTGDTVVEQVNRRIAKDRFSAFEYALWGIKTFEEEYYKKQRRKQVNLNQFIMFTKGSKRR